MAATVISIAGSLVADAILVKIAERVFPSTVGYVHFRFSDYAKLTVIGVVIACVAWPITCRITSTPRWVFFRMAIVVTRVLWTPDLWILIHDGQPIKAVAFLMCMHLAIALVTDNALVHVAPAGSLELGTSWTSATRSAGPGVAANGDATPLRGRYLGAWPPRPRPDHVVAIPGTSGVSPAGEVPPRSVESSITPSIERFDPSLRGMLASDLVVQDANVEPNAEWRLVEGAERRSQNVSTTSRSALDGEIVYFDRVCAVCDARHLCRLFEGVYICDNCRAPSVMPPPTPLDLGQVDEDSPGTDGDGR